MAETKTGMAAIAATHDDDQIAEAGDDQMGLPGIEQAAGHAGPGRPPGAKNRKTRELLNALGEIGQSPLEFLFRAYNTGRIARADGTEVPLDVKQRIDAAKASLPFWHEKQPIAIQADGKLFGLILGDGGGGDDDGDDDVLEVSFSEVPGGDDES